MQFCASADVTCPQKKLPGRWLHVGLAALAPAKSAGTTDENAFLHKNARLLALPLACTLVVARAHPGPGGQVPGIWEPGHIHSQVLPPAPQLDRAR